MSLNKVFLIGKVGKDAELAHVGSTTVAKFSLATKERWKDKDGNKKEATEWHNIELWGKQGESLYKWIEAGRELSIEGKITTQSWEKDGRKHYKTIIRAENIIFLGNNTAKKEDSHSGGRRRSQENDQDGEANIPEDDDMGLPMW